MPPRKTLFSGTTSSDDEDHTVTLSHDRAPGRRPVKPPPNRDAVFPPAPAKKKTPTTVVPGTQAPEPSADAAASNTGAATTGVPIAVARPPAVTVEEVPDAEDVPSRDSLPPDSPRVLEEVVNPQPSSQGGAAAPDSPDAPIEISDSDDDDDGGPPPAKSKKASRPVAVDSDVEETAPPKKKRKKSKGKAKKTVPERADPTETDKDGFLKDVSNAIDVEGSLREDQTDRTRDIREHFSKVRTVKQAGVHRQVRDCRTCARHRDTAPPIVAEVTTLRRHMEAYHKETYLRWCKSNNFKSMLPKDAQRRKNAALATANDGKLQTSIDKHLVELEKVVPYSDSAFKEVALEWLVETDQPIAALEHPKFREMIALAARARDGVRVPSGYDSRKAILRAFRGYLEDLKKRLASPAVKGKVSTTCDAWTSDPGDSYFAVTGHWVEETMAGVWELKSALFGFTHLPYAHHGRRLGQALFKILDRIDVAAKLGWVTCDNASNMNSMMREVELNMRLRGVTDFTARKRRIRCLAHVINLGTKALLKAYDEPQNRPEGVRNGVELVREIAIKEKSSSQRRQVFIDIQAAASVQHAVHLMKDMPVRWSSTKNMLKRGYDNRVHIAQFVTELERAEKNWRKRGAISALHVSEDEWNNIKLLLELLQAFSAETYSTLYNAVPALLSLCHAWEARSNDPRYADLRECLLPAIAKIKEFADDMQDSLNDAYYMAMVLHPAIKLGSLFHACWLGADDKADAVEEMFRVRFELLNGAAQVTPATPAPPGALQSLLAEWQPSNATASEVSAAEKWRTEYNSYMQSDHDIPKDMSLVRWWGMNSLRYPTWASLAGDYLSAMASSVSSERVFSSAGITVTKRRNKLQADIVEATQVLKAALRNDLLVRAAQPSSTLEDILEKAEEEERIAAYGDGSGDPQVATARADELQQLAVPLEFSDSDTDESDDDF